MNKKNILVTGGAGFIGSNLVGTLLEDERVNKVRVFDNLSTGFEHNIEEFYANSQFEFVKGDIRNYEEISAACRDIDLISHQAALGSVPRSIKDPLTTNDVNITGTLNVLQAAVQNGVKRVVFAASSSTYGDSPDLPKVEDKIGRPLSPYAVTKYVNELYADVFARTYGLEYIGLRYFNVFGPKQDPNGAYAAVIPLFFKAALEGKGPVIYGDGNTSRDFTYVSNAVEANIISLFIDNPDAVNNIYNIACGVMTTLKEIWQKIADITNNHVSPLHVGFRVGDINHSLASIEKAKQLLKFIPSVQVTDGLSKTLLHFKTFKE